MSNLLQQKSRRMEHLERGKGATISWKSLESSCQNHGKEQELECSTAKHVSHGGSMINSKAGLVKARRESQRRASKQAGYVSTGGFPFGFPLNQPNKGYPQNKHTHTLTNTYTLSAVHVALECRYGSSWQECTQQCPRRL